MAYGRDAQAEEILKDALAKIPLARRSASSSSRFTPIERMQGHSRRAANELRAATGGRGAEWEKVAALGLSIDPTNALTGASNPAPRWDQRDGADAGLQHETLNLRLSPLHR